MLRRYELVESKRFWELDRDGTSFTVRWGRIGANGRNERRHEYTSDAAATQAADKLFADKTKQGYQLVGKSKAKAAKAAPTVARSAAPKSNAKLEATIAENPDDVASWQVYGDWLLEQAEPWGEVIAHASAGRTPRTKQAGATEAMLDGIDGTKLKWKHGVVAEVELHPEEVPEDDSTPLEDALRRILTHPAGRLVRKLDIGLPPPKVGNIAWQFDSVIGVIAKAGPLPLLATLDMSHPAEHMDQDSWRRIGDLRPLWKAAPQLRELRLMGSRGSDRGGKPIVFGDIVAPHLEKLVYISSGLDASAPVDIGKSKLLALRHLELYFGRADYGNSCTMKSLAGILAGKGLPKLEYLGLENSEWEVELIETIVKSASLPRLRHLDLSKGVLYRKAAELLLAHAPKFRHLETLDLSDNYLWESIGDLKKAIPGVKSRGQREPEEDDGYAPYARYCSVGE